MNKAIICVLLILSVFSGCATTSNNLGWYKSDPPLNYQWQTIFSDDFDDNNNNLWLIEDNNIGSIQMQYGKYFFENRINYKAYTIGINLKKNILSDMNFAIESSIQKISGVDNYGYGLFFGEDFQNGYGFYIASNGTYTVIQRKNGIASSLIPWKEHSIINKGNSTNVVFIAKNSNVARFFINGTYVDEIHNLNFVGDYFGFSINKSQKIAVDYLRIAQ